LHPQTNMPHLIIGLGNPGAEYQNNRHNIGFKVVEKIADTQSFQSNRYADTCEINFKGRKLLLIKPTTYMNLSGKAVRYYIQEYKIPPEQILVVVDDLALDFGTLRLKEKGTDGGHNGLKSITEILTTDKYPRLKIGIGNNYPKGKQADFVLSNFNELETKSLPKIIATSAEATLNFVINGIAFAMTHYNKNVL